MRAIAERGVGGGHAGSGHGDRSGRAVGPWRRYSAGRVSPALGAGRAVGPSRRYSAGRVFPALGAGAAVGRLRRVGGEGASLRGGVHSGGMEAAAHSTRRGRDAAPGTPGGPCRPGPQRSRRQDAGAA